MDLTIITKHLTVDLALGAILGVVIALIIYQVGSYALVWLTKKLINKGINSISKDKSGDFVQGMLGMLNDPALQQNISNLLQPKQSKRKVVIKKDSEDEIKQKVKAIVDDDSDEEDDNKDEMKLARQKKPEKVDTKTAAPNVLAGISSMLNNGELQNQLNRPEVANLISGFAALLKPPAKAVDVPQQPPADD